MPKIVTYTPVILRIAAVVLLAIARIPVSLAQTTDAHTLPVGTIVNFGPDLQTTANGVCRQGGLSKLQGKIFNWGHQLPVRRPGLAKGNGVIRAGYQIR